MNRAVCLAISLIVALLTALPAASTSTAPLDPSPHDNVNPVGALRPAVEKRPEGNALNTRTDIPAANLWLCEAGPCAGSGEGSLRVIEHGSNIGEGLGAYALVIKYDPAVVRTTNPCDLVFGGSGPGSGRGPVDEVSSLAANADCADDAGPAAAGTCSMSRILEGLSHFACVTAGQAPGPTGGMDLASLELLPHPDLKSALYPASGNGVVSTVADLLCKLSDTLGEDLEGTSNGLAATCGDLTVTVRILEGDLDLDCDVDTADAQNIAGRIGASLGGALYDKWYDLEPAGRDFDIDIKDVQKVFGRLGSTCQAPIPAQPPVAP